MPWRVRCKARAASVVIEDVLGRYRAVCSCGWDSPFFDERTEAEKAGARHRST